MEFKGIQESKYSQRQVNWIQAKHFKSNGIERHSVKQVQSYKCEMGSSKAF